MLKEQHGCLQDPCLAQSIGFSKVSGEFVQVIHYGFGYWLIITNIGAESDAEVMVYDSLWHICTEAVALLHTEQKEIKVNIMNVQIQSGTCDWC